MALSVIEDNSIILFGYLPCLLQGSHASSVGQIAPSGRLVPSSWEPSRIGSAIVRTEPGRPLDHGRYQGGHVLEAVQTPDSAYNGASSVT